MAPPGLWGCSLGTLVCKLYQRVCVCVCEYVLTNV